MITAQRDYQANAQTIKTQDQMMQTLVNLALIFAEPEPESEGRAMDQLIYLAMTGAKQAAAAAGERRQQPRQRHHHRLPRRRSTFRAVPMRATARPRACLAWRRRPAPTRPGAIKRPGATSTSR